MRFMMTVNATKESEAGVPPSPELMARMGKLIEEMTRSGVLISTGGLLPSSEGARIKCSGGKVTVTDGPFTEAKELIAGFAIVEAQSKEHAIELSRRFWEVHGDGEGQIRQMDR